MKLVRINGMFVNLEHITLIQPNQRSVDIRFMDGNTLTITYDQWDALKAIIDAL